MPTFYDIVLMVLVSGLLLLGAAVILLARARAADQKLIRKFREEEELYLSTFYEAAVGIVHVRMEDGKFLRANKKICEMLGYTEEEFCQKTIADVTHPEDIAIDVDNSVKMAKGEVDMFCIQKRLLRKDGSHLWVKLTAVSIVRNEAGQALYGMAVCEDVTEVLLTLQALQESEARFQALAESVPVCIFEINPDQLITYVNKGFLDYTGLDTRQIYGKRLSEIILPHDQRQVENYLDATPQSQCRFEGYLQKADASYAHILVTAIPRFQKNGSFLGFLGSAVDITEQKNAQKHLEMAKIHAEEANRRKSEFLSMMSHELRTPLNSIIGFSELLEIGEAGPLNAEQKELLKYVINSGHHLLQLVNDLLDLSKIEAGKMSLFLDDVDLNLLMLSVKQIMGEIAKQKQVSIEIDVNTQVQIIKADPFRLKQVFINLVSNAIKFNRPGGRVSIRVQETGDGWITCLVHDTGIGIPEDKLSSLFNKFYQLDTSAARNYEGTGLGLALTKELVLLHGGEIHVASEPGIGSTFTVRLPLYPNDKQAFEGSAPLVFDFSE